MEEENENDLPAFGIEDSEELYDRIDSVPNFKSIIKYEITFVNDERKSLVIKNLMASNMFETEIARECALATELNPSNVRAVNDMEPQLKVEVEPLPDTDEHVETSTQNDDWITVLITVLITLLIVLCCCGALSFGYIKFKYWQNWKGSGGRNSTFQKFKDARKEAKSMGIGSINSKNNDNSNEIQLPAVAISFDNNEGRVKTTMINQVVNTSMGKGKILQIRKQDDISIVELQDWKLANGSKVILYIYLPNLERQKHNQVYI